MTTSGYQVVDLDDDATFRHYLNPRGRRIPVFPLIGVLYSFSQPSVYPSRPTIGIPEFAADFHFSIDQVERLFEADPEHPDNRVILALVGGHLAVPEPVQPGEPAPQPLPVEPEPSALNTGVGAELLVAKDVQQHGWAVEYVANLRSLGYDLRARQSEQTLRVEVKSSVGACTPEFTEDEWRAAQEYGDDFILAVVDFYGSPGQRIYYVRNPAANLVPAERYTIMYRFSRQETSALAVDADFL
jgi:hypothetical protein